jgi:hypothetical protein
LKIDNAGVVIFNRLASYVEKNRRFVVDQRTWNSYLENDSTFSALAVDLVEEDGRGAADVERIYRGRHRNGHGVVAGFKYRGGNALALAAENEAAIAGEIGLRQRFAVRMGMGRDAADAMVTEGLQGRWQMGRFDDRQLKNGAHRIADGPAQVRAGTSLAHEQTLDPKGGAVSHQGAQVFGVGETIHGGEEAYRAWLARESARPP